LLRDGVDHPPFGKPDMAMEEHLNAANREVGIPPAADAMRDHGRPVVKVDAVVGHGSEKHTSSPLTVHFVAIERSLESILGGTGGHASHPFSQGR
jgi:hypothetical protein